MSTVMLTLSFQNLVTRHGKKQIAARVFLLNGSAFFNTYYQLSINTCITSECKYLDEYSWLVVQLTSLILSCRQLVTPFTDRLISGVHSCSLLLYCVSLAPLETTWL